MDNICMDFLSKEKIIHFLNKPKKLSNKVNYIDLFDNFVYLEGYCFSDEEKAGFSSYYSSKKYLKNNGLKDLYRYFDFQKNEAQERYLDIKEEELKNELYEEIHDKIKQNISNNTNYKEKVYDNFYFKIIEKENNFKNNPFFKRFTKEQKNEIINQKIEGMKYDKKIFIDICSKIAEKEKINNIENIPFFNEYKNNEKLELLNEINEFKDQEKDLILCLDDFTSLIKENLEFYKIYQILGFMMIKHTDYYISNITNKSLKEEIYFYYCYYGNLEKVKEIYDKVNLNFPHEVCLIISLLVGEHEIINFLFEKFEERFKKSIKICDLKKLNIKDTEIEFLEKKLK